MIVMPDMPTAQAASWHSIMQVYERLDQGWTMVGGQMVHVHCAERDYTPVRPTNDADMILDVRADPKVHHNLTAILADLGFTPAGISAEGVQHRWQRGEASIDVLLPEGIGERAASRPGASGSPTIATAGGTQALLRTEPVHVSVNGREGWVRRPNIVGALVMKAAAHTAPGDGAKPRHRLDFATLALLVAAKDFRDEKLTRTDRRRLREMTAATRADQRVILTVPNAEASLDRLERATRLTLSPS